MPPEILESLAYSNYDSPRPRPIDPAVFFDLVKVRRLVEEATDLAVRAANGTTSSSLGSSLNAANGLLGGGSAAALGLGLGPGGPSAKLSRERKHRMRELATQKLSRAYQLDEVAASVATMQGASSLEEVAKLVLQRNNADCDAKYVHFFHEKIPSRMLAQSTSLRALDEVIQDRPTQGAKLRTRAVLKIFKDDHYGAAHDLSEALSACRCAIAQHKAGRGQLKLANALGGSERRNGGSQDRRHEVKIDDADHPSSLEAQLLFHRAGTYLTLACQSIQAALESSNAPHESSVQSPQPNEMESPDADARRLKARNIVRTNAKRALRDYLSFLSHFDYTPGLPSNTTGEFFPKVNPVAGGLEKPRDNPPAKRLLETATKPSSTYSNISDSILLHKSQEYHSYPERALSYMGEYPTLPSPQVYAVPALFSSSPPADLPPYPAVSQALSTRKPAIQQRDGDGIMNPLYSYPEQHEAVTYHPLLTDALHSLLLCHSIIQTSPKELLRHAHMVARLARICDGYPMFLAARSPSRADWIEVIERGGNWIGLQQSWESLCTPAPLPGQAGPATRKETEEQARERRRQEAIVEALADEQVHDEVSLQAAVAARERRAEKLWNGETFQKGTSSPKRWAQEDGKEYPASSERSEAVIRWVKEVPATLTGSRKTKPGSGRAKAQTTKEGTVTEGDSASHLALSDNEFHAQSEKIDERLAG